MRLMRVCLLFAVPLAVAQTCPITPDTNAWSWGAEGDDLFWMWYWLACFTLLVVGAAWMAMEDRP